MASVQREIVLDRPIGMYRPMAAYATQLAPEPVARPRVVVPLLAILIVVAGVAAWMWFGHGFGL